MERGKRETTADVTQLDREKRGWEARNGARPRHLFHPFPPSNADVSSLLLLSLSLSASPYFSCFTLFFLLISLPLSASLSLSFSWLNASTSARWRTHDEADTRLDCSSRVKATLFPSLRNPSPSAREKSAGGRSELDGNEAASAAATRFRVGWGSLPDTTGSTKEKKRGKKEEKNASRSIADEASWHARLSHRYRKVRANLEVVRVIYSFWLVLDVRSCLNSGSF